MTAQDVINGALIALQEMDPEETPTASESADGLGVLNRLIASWNAEVLPIPQITRSEVTLTGAASYSLPTRPLKIRAASVVVTTTVSMPLNIADAAAWAAYMDKAGDADFGEILYLEDGYPLAKVHIAPLVATGTLELLSLRPIGKGLMANREEFTLEGAASYTIGIDGDFDTERPAEITGAAILAGSTIAKEVEIVTAEKWAAFLKRGEGGSFARVLFYDGGWPTGTVRLAPSPAAGTLELLTLNALEGFASLSATVDLPPGYERALVFNTALDWASSFGADPALVAGPAQQSRNAIAALNAQVLGLPAPVSGSAQPAPAPEAPRQ